MCSMHAAKALTRRCSHVDPPNYRLLCPTGSQCNHHQQHCWQLTTPLLSRPMLITCMHAARTVVCLSSQKQRIVDFRWRPLWCTHGPGSELDGDEGAVTCVIGCHRKLLCGQHHTGHGRRVPEQFTQRSALAAVSPWLVIPTPFLAKVPLPVETPRLGSLVASRHFSIHDWGNRRQAARCILIHLKSWRVEEVQLCVPVMHRTLETFRSCLVLIKRFTTTGFP
jgi:hypothetical protein